MENASQPKVSSIAEIDWQGAGYYRYSPDYNTFYKVDASSVDGLKARGIKVLFFSKKIVR